MDTFVELLLERPEIAVGISVAVLGGLSVACRTSSKPAAAASKTKKDKRKAGHKPAFEREASIDHFRVEHSPKANRRNGHHGHDGRRDHRDGYNQHGQKSKKQLAKEREAAYKKAEKKRRQREKKAKAASEASKAPANAKASRDSDDEMLFGVQHSPTLARAKKAKKSAAERARAKREAEQEALRKQAAINAADGWSTAGVTKKKKKKHRGGHGHGNGHDGSNAVEAENAHKVHVSIDSKKIGHVIGPKGATLHKIQDVSGARVDMPNRDRDAHSAPGETSKVTLTGTPEQCKVARRAILDIVNKGYSTALDKDLLEGYIKVHPSKFHEIYGRGGSTIRALQDKLNVRINVPKGAKGVSSTQVSHRVGIVGERAAVKRAKETIALLVKQHWTPVTHPGFASVEVAVPPEQYSLIIGPRGQTIKSIEGDTRCKIHIPDKLDDAEAVLVVGPAANVAKAAQRVVAVVKAGFTKRSYDDDDA
jgi:predicted RNA-binding protein YlqC (UPF0109 family)